MGTPVAFCFLHLSFQWPYHGLQPSGAVFVPLSPSEQEHRLELPCATLAAGPMHKNIAQRRAAIFHGWLAPWLSLFPPLGGCGSKVPVNPITVTVTRNPRRRVRRRKTKMTMRTRSPVEPWMRMLTPRDLQMERNELPQRKLARNKLKEMYPELAIHSCMKAI